MLESGERWAACNVRQSEVNPGRGAWDVDIHLSGRRLGDVTLVQNSRGGFDEHWAEGEIGAWMSADLRRFLDDGEDEDVLRIIVAVAESAVRATVAGGGEVDPRQMLFEFHATGCGIAR